MEQQLTQEDLEARAIHRRTSSPCGIGAAFDGDRTENDRDEAHRWRFVVTDTMHGCAAVEFIATRIAYNAALLTEPLEEAVELFAGRYPLEKRMEALVSEYEENGPIHLPLDERFRVPAPIDD